MHYFDYNLEGNEVLVHFQHNFNEHNEHNIVVFS